MPNALAQQFRLGLYFIDGWQTVKTCSRRVEKGNSLLNLKRPDY